jgi:hypothetical protein
MPAHAGIHVVLPVFEETDVRPGSPLRGNRSDVDGTDAASRWMKP